MLYEKEIVYALMLNGDFDDLCPAFGCTYDFKNNTCNSKIECENTNQNIKINPKDHPKPRKGDNHCSILIKPLG
jgi:hypothetical protein